MLPDGVVGPYNTRFWEILTSMKKFLENRDNRRQRQTPAERGLTILTPTSSGYNTKQPCPLFVASRNSHIEGQEVFVCLLLLLSDFLIINNGRKDHRDPHQSSCRVPTSWLGVQFSHSRTVEFFFCGWRWELLTSRWQLKQTSHRDTSATGLDFPALHIFKMSRINSLRGGFHRAGVLFFFFFLISRFADALWMHVQSGTLPLWYYYYFFFFFSKCCNSKKVDNRSELLRSWHHDFAC